MSGCIFGIDAVGRRDPRFPMLQVANIFGYFLVGSFECRVTDIQAVDVTKRARHVDEGAAISCASIG